MTRSRTGSPSRRSGRERCRGERACPSSAVAPSISRQDLAFGARQPRLARRSSAQSLRTSARTITVALVARSILLGGSGAADAKPVTHWRRIGDADVQCGQLPHRAGHARARGLRVPGVERARRDPYRRQRRRCAATALDLTAARSPLERREIGDREQFNAAHLRRRLAASHIADRCSWVARDAARPRHRNQRRDRDASGLLSMNADRDLTIHSGAIVRRVTARK